MDGHWQVQARNVSHVRRTGDWIVYPLTLGHQVVDILSAVVDCESKSQVFILCAFSLSALYALPFRAAGRGVFSMHSSLEILYYRMLGARIGKNVYIDKQARLGEYDLITLHDGCRIDTSLVRGFCVEREGFFRLDNITIGRRAVINTHTMIAPGANIPDRAVYGPHASSHDPPSPKFYAAYNRTWIAQPHWSLQAFVAWPIIVSVIFISCQFYYLLYHVTNVNTSFI